MKPHKRHEGFYVYSASPYPRLQAFSCLLTPIPMSDCECVFRTASSVVYLLRACLLAAKGALLLLTCVSYSSDAGDLLMQYLMLCESILACFSLIDSGRMRMTEQDDR